MCYRSAVTMANASRRLWILVSLCCALSTGLASADDFSTYDRRLDREFLLPDVLRGRLGGTVMDHLSDGRLLLLQTGLRFDTGLGFDVTESVELRVESSPGSRDFRYLGDLTLPATDPLWFQPGGFLTVAPEQGGIARIAVGNANVSVGIFSTSDLTVPAIEPAAGTPAALSTQWYSSLGLGFVAAGHWVNDHQLAINTGNFVGSQVNLLDASSNPLAPVAPPIVGSIPGASGGVAQDSAGNLLIGIGAGARVGEIRRFDEAAWPAGDLGYLADGALVTTRLSAGWLQTDAEGSLFIGGGDTFDTGSGDDDNFAIHDLSPLARPRRLFDPDNTLFQGEEVDNAYSLVLNAPLRELYVWDNFVGNTRQVFVYVPVPEPASVVGLMAGALGLAAVVRRRGEMAASCPRD